MVIVRAPLRISLMGGGSDIPDHFMKHGGACVGLAINKYLYVSLKTRYEGGFLVSYTKREEAPVINMLKHELARDVLRFFQDFHWSDTLKHYYKQGLEITSIGDLPGSSGLGSSSAFTVALTSAMYRMVFRSDLEPKQAAKAACAIEVHRLQHPIGYQDQFFSALGGWNVLRFDRLETVVSEPLFPTGKNLLKSMLLLDLGKQRSADKVLTRQLKRSKQNAPALNTMASMVPEMAKFVLDDNVEDVGWMLSEAWKLKRTLADGITNEYFDELYTRAMGEGAYGGKILGAGGGGFLLVVSDPCNHDRIVESTRLRRVPFGIDKDGVKCVYQSEVQ